MNYYEKELDFFYKQLVFTKQTIQLRSRNNLKRRDAYTLLIKSKGLSVSINTKQLVPFKKTIMQVVQLDRVIVTKLDKSIEKIKHELIELTANIQDLDQKKDVRSLLQLISQYQQNLSSIHHNINYEESLIQKKELSVSDIKKAKKIWMSSLEVETKIATELAPIDKINRLAHRKGKWLGLHEAIITHKDIVQNIQEKNIEDDFKRLKTSLQGIGVVSTLFSGIMLFGLYLHQFYKYHQKYKLF